MSSRKIAVDETRDASAQSSAAGWPAQDYPKYRALSISPALEDHAALRELLSGFCSEVVAAKGSREAFGELKRQSIALIFCEATLPDGNWKRVFDFIKIRSAPSLLIVTSRFADEHLWSEVLNLGAYDVLAKPFRQQEVHYVLTSASLWLKASSCRTSRTAIAG